MESKVCSRSQGQPPGARRRAMIWTARSKRSPVVGMGKTTVNEWQERGQRRERSQHFSFPRAGLVVSPLFTRGRVMGFIPLRVRDERLRLAAMVPGNVTVIGAITRWTMVLFPKTPSGAKLGGSPGARTQRAYAPPRPNPAMAGRRALPGHRDRLWHQWCRDRAAMRPRRQAHPGGGAARFRRGNNQPVDAHHPWRAALPRTRRDRASAGIVARAPAVVA